MKISKQKTMSADICKSCLHVKWLIGIGQGVRCSLSHNQQYKKDNREGFVLIDNVPALCQLYELKMKNRSMSDH